MGQRGEVFSKKVFVDEGRKTYFFNVKENRFRDLYINIAESRRVDEGFKRSSLVVFAEDLKSFLQGFEQAANIFDQGGQDIHQQVEVGGGRRLYQFRTPPSRGSLLEIVESRNDTGGQRREIIRIHRRSLLPFREGLTAAVHHIRDIESSGK